MKRNLGTTLRDARERRGISLRQIASATKISVAALESIERNDFSRLPGGIFSRAFLRSYALEVGLDPDQIVQDFLEQTGEQPAGDRSEAPGDEAPLREHSPAVSHHHAQPDWDDEFDFESKQRMAAVVLKLVVVSLPVAAAILYFSSRDAHPTQSAFVPAETASAVSEEPAASPPAESGIVPAADVPVPAIIPRGNGFTIEVIPTGDCWVQLSADGQVLISRLLKAGERETRQVREAAVLQVGDAAACAISLNGRRARPLGAPRQPRRLQITRDNYGSFLE